MKQKHNTKDLLNIILLRLTGSLSLANLWWKSPNLAFCGKTPIAMWKGTTADQLKVKRYLIQMVNAEGAR